MKKFWLVVLALAMTVCLALGLTACGGKTDTSVNGTYYRYESEQLDKTDWYELKDGTWRDSLGEQGTYKLSGGAISFYQDVFGENVNWATGTVKDGVLSITALGVTHTYCKEGSTPSGGGQGGSQDGSPSEEFEVTFILNYAGADNVVKATKDGLITYIPARDDYVFNGWWLSDGQTEDGEYILAQRWDTSEKVTEEGLVLVAEWVEKSTVSAQLPAPIVSIEGDEFSWQEVPGAVSYDIRVSGSLYQGEEARDTVYGTSWTFPSSFEAGYYTVKIRAMGDGETTVNSAYVSKSYGHRILSAVSNISFDISTSILTWAAVRNATSYDVSVDGQEAETLTCTTYDLSDLEAGRHTVTIVAKRDGYQSSTVNQTIEKKRLKTPKVTVTPDESGIRYTVSWESVLHADTYIVTLNGEEHRVTDADSYTFDRTAASWKGAETISVTVTAFDSNSDYLISEPSEEEQVSTGYRVKIEMLYAGAGVITMNEIARNEGGFAPEEEVTIQVTTNEGYSWDGWYDGAERIESSEILHLTVQKSVTYQAKWTLTQYALILDYDENIAETTDEIPSSYTIEGIDLPTLTGKNGNEHVHTGWSAGDGTKFKDQLPKGKTGDLTLSPIWESSDWTQHFGGGACPLCGAEQQIYVKSQEGTIYFGEYPQDEVKETDLKASLGWEAGDLPTTAQAGKWTRYGYRKASSTGSVRMWYIDVTYCQKKYRGVYFTEYRDDHQSSNGYVKDTVYWFRYEPVEWNILEEKNGIAFLASRRILDCQPFYVKGSLPGQTTSANNYANSDIRRWLNNAFYTTAFNQFTQTLIEQTTVDNSAATTASDDNKYTCNDTLDKVFLLSYRDFAEGRCSLKWSGDPSKYAKSQGVYYGQYWLRSPDATNSNCVLQSAATGDRTISMPTSSPYAVVPALRIRLGK